MKYLFHLGHPAHFHLYKNLIFDLQAEGNQTFILIKKKDILENLLIDAGFQYHNIMPGGRGSSLYAIGFGLLKQDLSIFRFCLKQRPDIMIGSSTSIAHVGKILNIPSIVLGEDDAAIIPFFAKLTFPFASTILTPDVCNNGKWNSKSIKYKGYHELAYLHPEHFTPDKKIAEKCVDLSKPYFLVRFAKLDAHHDSGISGINDAIAQKIIEILKPFGTVYITSERKLRNELESHRLHIQPLDIHHVMAYASLYIGDSQTMAAEAGVLGVPFIRYNDFVGKIGYLNDLEDKYKLGYGIRSNNEEILFNTVKEILHNKNRVIEWEEKRKLMLSEKINVAKFISWFINDYPESSKIMKHDSNYQHKFK